MMVYTVIHEHSEWRGLGMFFGYFALRRVANPFCLDTKRIQKNQVRGNAKQ